MANAKVFTDYIGMSDGRAGTSRDDGIFSLAGCKPGPELLTASAPGFAPTTLDVLLADNAEPVHLVLRPGKLLRLKVVDNVGNPVPKASVWHDCGNGQPPINPLHPVTRLPQMEWMGRGDIGVPASHYVEGKDVKTIA